MWLIVFVPGTDRRAVQIMAPWVVSGTDRCPASETGEIN